MDLLIILPLALICFESSFAGNPSHRIIGGRVTLITDVPFFVIFEIKRVYHEILPIYGWCGATILSDRWLLTAAHCVFHNPTDPVERQARLHHSVLTVYAGVDKFYEKDYAEARIVSNFTHEKFNRTMLHNDIALLKMNESLKFSDRIKAIELPSKAKEELEYTNGTIVGFGATDLGRLDIRERTNELMSTEINLIHDDAYCRSKQDRYNPEVMFCAGVKEGGRDACTGDSGGPFVINRSDGSKFIGGIISFGQKGCGKKDDPGQYTRVSSYIEWIKNTMAKN